MILMFFLGMIVGVVGFFFLLCYLYNREKIMEYEERERLMERDNQL